MEEFITLLLEFIDPTLIIIAVVLACIGLFLKLTPLVKSNWIIPFALWGLGIVFVILWYGVVDGKGFALIIFVQGILQGTMVAALPVFGHQLVKQYRDKK